MRRDQLFSVPVLIFLILNYLCMLALFSFLSNLGIGKGFLLSFPFFFRYPELHFPLYSVS